MQVTESTLGIVQDFTAHCCEKLGLSGEVNIELATEPLDHPTAGMYLPQENRIIVCVVNRAIADCLRTLAHELTHKKQRDVDGVEEFPDNDDELQKYEDEANVMSGRLVRFYGREHREIYADLG